MEYIKLNVLFIVLLFHFMTTSSFAKPQQLQTNNQYSISAVNTNSKSVTTLQNETQVNYQTLNAIQVKTEPSGISKIYAKMMAPLRYMLSAPKINSVMKNIGTCVVNGAVEIISYYFPAPLIPIIASAAGMLMPFEPILMLRDKSPVTSYRRAFMTALNTFLEKFDKYKLNDNDEYDPYMTQRFNRRMMNYGSNEKSKNDEPMIKRY